MKEVEQFQWTDLNDLVDRFVIITVLNRPGARLFGVKLEYEHYPPRTPKNEEYQYGMGMWQEMMMVSISIPKKDRPVAEAVAAELGMTLTKDRQVLLVSSNAGLKEFPAIGDHIAHLQGGYEGDEDAALDAIFKADQPARKEFLMERINPRMGRPELVSDWTKYLKVYPLLHARLLDTQPDILHVIVAVFDQDAFGFVTICQKPGEQPYMGVLYVDEEERRWGIGSMLVASAIDVCSTRGIGPLKIDSRSEVLDKITANFPEGYNDLVQVNSWDNDLFIEQQAVGPLHDKH